MPNQLILKFREVNRDIFEAVHDGKKTIETRAATTKYCKIATGDTVVLSCGSDRFTKQVGKVKLFKTINALVKNYKISSINPNCTTIKELTEMYYSFPGYKDKIQTHGIIAFELK